MLISLQPVAPVNEQDLIQIMRLVHRHTGIAQYAGNAITLRNAVMHRMNQVNLTSTHDYLQLLTNPNNSTEISHLTSLVVVTKTSFFRDRGQFRMLEKEVLPNLIRKKGGADFSLRIWCAGCSIGAEPYSVAIILKRNNLSPQRSSILASDISPAVLERGKKGIYTQLELEDLNEEEWKYFEPAADCWSVKKLIGSYVSFQMHNLTSVPLPLPREGYWDIIFCRNVLIYFSRETVREIIMSFREILNPGGFLFLGSSESLFKLTEGFEILNSDKAFVYRKPERAAEPISPRREASRMSTKKPTIRTTRLTTDTYSSISDRHPHKRDRTISSQIQEARQLLSEDNAQGALHLLFETIRSHPKELEPYLILGQIALERGELGEALSWFQAAAETQPLDLESRFLLSFVHYRLGHDPEAATELKKLLFLDGEFGLGHYYLGIVAERMNDRLTATRSHQNVLRIFKQAKGKPPDPLLTKHELSLDALAAASQARLDHLSKTNSGNGVAGNEEVKDSHFGR